MINTSRLPLGNLKALPDSGRTSSSGPWRSRETSILWWRLSAMFLFKTIVTIWGPDCRIWKGVPKLGPTLREE